MNELALIDWLRKRLRQSEDVILGPGDDCALLDVSADSVLAATCDTFLEGTHFSVDDDPRLIGHKCAAANLSDLAAMGCRPRWGFTGLGLRRGLSDEWLLAFAEGLANCAEEYGLSLSGGDFTTGEGPVSVSLTVFGSPFPGGPIRRNGAKPGDIIAVTGTLGGSLAGKHLSFEPRLKESKHLCAGGALHAMMDLSDGLSLDLRRMCHESSVGAVVERSLVPVSPEAMKLADGNEEAAFLRALCDGEDFELLLALDAEQFNAILSYWPFEAELTRIGTFTDDKRLILKNGNEETDFPEGGYIHA